MRREIEEAANLVPRILGRELAQLCKVRAVHREQEIEMGVIGARDLTRALARNVDAAPTRRAMCARVGRLTDMPIAKSGGINLEQMIDAFFLGDAAEDALGHGRTADISQTNKEKAVLGHAGSDGMRSEPVQGHPIQALLLTAQQEEAALTVCGVGRAL
jgi:nucleotide-binding universal stress UspA family protein